MRLAALQFRFIPSTGLTDASDTAFFRRIHEYRTVTQPIQVTLEQQRGIENDGPDRAVTGCVTHHIRSPLINQGVHQLLQPLPLHGVGKHDAGNRLAIHPATRQDHTITPPRT